ncbi:MAG: exostosin family protein [Leptolyngbyaceae cyanobacterium bins.59]|nr:exostosin family protein [Leptolyngbyaceae cyanobacterium bins.59]
MPHQFGIQSPLEYIQMMRLCCALLESNFEIYFPVAAKPLLQYWSQYFPIQYHLGLEQVPLLHDLEISHTEPFCRLGTLKRSLIFPHGMVQWCRQEWQTDRPTQFLFCGLITEKRKRCLEGWIQACFGRNDVILPTQDVQYGKLKRLLTVLKKVRQGWHRSPSRYEIPELGLCISASQKGRQFPGKIWDDDYYRSLAQAQFVLCPDGDYTWTYRFFESILCGAIPIIENTCSSYDGFEFFSMQDPIDRLVYSPEMAERNFEKAVERLTLPMDELNAELTRLLQGDTNVATSL